MKKILEIKMRERLVIFDGNEYRFDEIGFSFDKTPLTGVMSVEYLIEVLKDYEGYPNKISVSKKLSKYKKNLSTD